MHPRCDILGPACASALVAALTCGTAAPAIAGGAQGMEHPGHASHAAAMDDAAMRRLVDDWYAVHPRVGGDVAGRDTPVLGADATFTLSGTRFDADGSSATVVDTVHIQTGQTVLWQWVNGVHTVTSGEGSLDPNAGLLFDQPVFSSSPTFMYTFNSAGVVPFFCSPHEGFDMRGVVVVVDPVGVPPLPGGPGVGFVADPWPNPSSGGVAFRFALPVDGRVRADVIDARGRFVATITDRTYAAGTHAASWDGRGARGPAPAGVYYLRLHVPGFVGGRTFVLRR